MRVFCPFNCHPIWAKYLISEEMPNLCCQENDFLDDSHSSPDSLICTCPNTDWRRVFGDSQSPPANPWALAETCSCLLLPSFKTSDDRNSDGECVYKTARGGREKYEGKVATLTYTKIETNYRSKMGVDGNMKWETDKIFGRLKRSD